MEREQARHEHPDNEELIRVVHMEHKYTQQKNDFKEGRNEDQDDESIYFSAVEDQKS